MKVFLAVCTWIICFQSLAKEKDLCTTCDSALKLEKRIADSKIIPDQMNARTIERQDQFVGDSAEAIKKLLKQRPFNREHAHSLLKLLSRISCFYDNQGDIAGLNRDLFKGLYETRGSVLKTELELMIKSGEITEKRSKAMLETIGAIPAADYIPAGCADYK